jgi:hypothetical protein
MEGPTKKRVFNTVIEAWKTRRAEQDLAAGDPGAEGDEGGLLAALTSSA